MSWGNHDALRGVLFCVLCGNPLFRKVVVCFGGLIVFVVCAEGRLTIAPLLPQYWSTIWVWLSTNFTLSLHLASKMKVLLSILLLVSFVDIVWSACNVEFDLRSIDYSTEQVREREEAWGKIVNLYCCCGALILPTLTTRALLSPQDSLGLSQKPGSNWDKDQQVWHCHVYCDSWWREENHVHGARRWASCWYWTLYEGWKCLRTSLDTWKPRSQAWWCP